MTGQRIARLALVVQHLTVHDNVLDPARGHYQTTTATGQIVAHLATLVRADGIVVENDDIGGHTRQQAPATLDAEVVSRLRRYSLDCMFQRKHLPITHPGAEEIGAVAG